MSGYVFGLDGGATKTQCAVFDLNGNMVEMLNWGPTNHEVLQGGFEELRCELEKIFDCILGKCGISKAGLIRSVFGMAGADTREQHNIISGILNDLGVRDYILCNDAYLGVKAGAPDGCGICVINGTGSTVAGINKAGRMFQIGGLGGLTGDPGGGGILGEAAVRSTYNYLFRSGKNTKIAELMFKEIGISSKYDFLDTLTEKIRRNEISLKELNRYIFEAADQNDEVALGILEKAGREYGLSVNSIIRELEFGKSEALHIVLAGSVNVKGSNPMLVNALKEEVLKCNPEMNISFSTLTEPPVLGAVLWALDEAGADRYVRNTVLQQL